MNQNFLNSLKELKLKVNAEKLQALKSELKLDENRQKIETKLKDLVETAKQNPRVVKAWNEVVNPVLQSEKTKSALTKLQEKFPNQALLNKIETLLNTASTAAEAKDVTATEPVAKKTAAEATKETTAN